MTKYLFLLMLLTSCSAFAELTWQTTELLINHNENLPAINEGNFLFKNESDETIVIKDIKVSCGCTKVPLKKKVYKPGESGAIPYKINLKGRSSDFSKRIFVHIDKLKDPKQLILSIKFPKITQAKQSDDKVVKAVKNDLQSEKSAEPPSGVVLYEQQNCPFQGTSIKRELYVDHRGKRIYTCCEECIPLVKAAPELAISRLYEMKEYPLSVERAEKKYPKTKISSN